MKISDKIKAATILTYNPTTDVLYADGKRVGRASALTRKLMIALLSDPADHADESNETLFDMVVVTI